jgi:glycosyltransferase involved in cell wall biosynthesis
MPGSTPKISFLTVTGGRPEFMPWLLWNYRRQAYDNKELIIVDSSEEAALVKEAIVIPAPGSNVPTMRNIALETARGDHITWLDDDDWRHPQFCRHMLAGLETPIVGGRVAYFVNLLTGGIKRHIQRRIILFACLLVETAVARQFRFDESQDIGTDILWMDALLPAHPWSFTYSVPSLFLCHDRNMGNLASRHEFNRDIDEIKSAMTKKDWGDTDKQMANLHKRLWK